MEVQVAYMRFDTHGDAAILQIQVASPVAQLAASFFAHDSVDVAWRGAFNLKATDNPHVWSRSWRPHHELTRLVEIGNLTSDDPTLGPLRPGPARWVFLRPESGEGEWIQGERAQIELRRIEQARDERFTTPLMASDTSKDAPKFLILAIADNLLITQPQRVPGISLTPMKSELGDDVRTVLNRILRGGGIANFLEGIPKVQWLQKMQQNRPAVQIECHVRAENPEAARDFSVEVMKRLLDMMTLRRGAAARLIAGVVAENAEGGRYKYHGAWIEHSGYGENLLGGVIAGEDVHALQSSWSRLQANPQAQLWVSLYADAVRDPRWEYQLFRCFSLLEAIADEVVQVDVSIRDEAGNLRPLPKDKRKHFTTGGTQGKVYMLLTRIAGGGADDQRWDDVVVWTEVRHAVAHEGTWRPPSDEAPERAATHDAIISRGRDGTLESGGQALVKKIRESVKKVLYEAIYDRLVDAPATGE